MHSEEINLIKRENKLAELQIQYNSLYTELLKQKYQNLQKDAISLKKRTELLLVREKRLKAQQNLLKDKIRSFRAAQKETLNV